MAMVAASASREEVAWSPKRHAYAEWSTIKHHIHWVTDVAALHEASVRRAFAAIGLPSPSSDVRSRLDALSV